MESNWYRFAKYLEEEQDVAVDYLERFFECPECGEHIYECDWRDEDYWNSKGEYHGKWYCPVCRKLLTTF